MRHFIFDLDDTLTPSHQKMDNEFSSFFVDKGKTEKFYIVTGSSYPQTLEQLGKASSVIQVFYCCMGNYIQASNMTLFQSDWKLPEHLVKYFKELIENSKFIGKTSSHLEQRIGSCNFSIVGQDANQNQRDRYIQYDKENNDRLKIIEEFNKKYKKSGIVASFGGSTSIDIFPYGKGKSQILQDFPVDHEIHFFGDRVDKHGNDYDIAKELNKSKWKNAKVHSVKNWQETYKKLVDILNK